MKTRVKKKDLETRVSKSRLGEQIPLIREDYDKQSTVDSFLDHISSKRAPNGQRGKPKPTEIDIAVCEAKRRSRDGDWKGTKGKVFVGLFGICHEIVYGDIPLELNTKREMMIGAKAANRVLHDYFGDNPDALVEFIKWSWEVEKRKESWALRNGIARNRMRVYFQFSTQLIQDYRTDQKRNLRRV